MADIWPVSRARSSTKESRKDFAQASGALDRLAEQPDNKRLQGAVEDHLDEILSADADFAASLSELVERMKATGHPGVQVRDSGAVAIGGNVSVKGTRQVAGRDITISAPGK